MGGIPGLGPTFDWTELRLEKGAERDPARLRQVAGQFEALLVGELMKTMREAAGGGWLGGEGSGAGLAISELAEQQVAQAICLQGGLGLAPLIVQGLEKSAEKSSLVAE